jgi:hypothetical protein
MKRFTCCLCATVVLLASAVARADAKSDAAARAKAIAPFVEAETALVIHVDLTRVDPGAVTALAARFQPGTAREMAVENERMLNERRKVVQAGVKEFYIVVTPGNQGWIPRVYGVVPVGAEADIASIRAALTIPADSGRVIRGSLVFSLPPDHPAEKQLRDFKPVERPELAKAFEAAGNGAVQIALIPPVYVQRVVEELMPQFPKELGGGPTSVVTKGVSWAAVGIELSPRPELRLTIQSADAQAAEAFRSKMAEVFRLVGLQKEVRATAPKFGEIAAALLPTVEGDRLVLVLNEQNGGVEKVVSLLTPPIKAARGAAARAQSTNNLKQLALAMHNYHSVNKHFVLPASRGKDGKPLLSWRVYMLPYIEQDALFKQFHLDEPWDSPHNRTLIDKMPTIYRLPGSKLEKGRTNYLLPVGGGAVFEADKPTLLKDITDGTSNTIMIVEADDDHAVIWTKPEDLSFDPKDPSKGLSHFFDGGFNAALCDGSVRWLSWPKDANEMERLGYLIQRADRHPVQPW